MERSIAMSTSPNKKSRIESHSESIRYKTHNYFITVSPGFEFLAEEELAEKVRPTAMKRVDRSGKIFFSTDQPLKKLLRLRSADHLYAFVCEHIGVPSDASGLTYLEHTPQSFDWSSSLDLWRSSKSIEKEEADALTIPNPSPSTEPTPPLEPLFRVTGKREGNHTYKSFEVAGSVGAALITKFGYKVSLKSFNMEVLADLTGDTLVVGISLTSQPLFVRRHSAVPKTSLKSSIAYCMGRLARIRDGQKVFDPMMGMGTIPIELAEVWGKAHYVASDIQQECHSDVVKHMNDIGAPIDVIRWNGYKVPLAPESVDLIVSDISVGRRGATKNHQQLYPKLLREATRILKIGGKCLLLTNEKHLMHKMLSDNLYWKTMAMYGVDVNGTDGALYLLQRSQYKVGQLPFNLASTMEEDRASQSEASPQKKTTPQ